MGFLNGRTYREYITIQKIKKQMQYLLGLMLAVSLLWKHIVWVFKIRTIIHCETF